MSSKPHQRRGLGRGLGSLIPTGPRPDADARDGVDDAVEPGRGSLRVQTEPADREDELPDGSGRHAASPVSLGRTSEEVEPPSARALTEPDTSDSRSTETLAERVALQAHVTQRPQVPAVAVPGVADWIGAPLPGDVVDESPTAGTPWPTATSLAEHSSADNPSDPSTAGSAEPAAAGSAEDARSGTPPTATTEFASLDAERTDPAPSESAEDDGPRPVTGAWFAELAVGDITPNPRQPREVFDEDSMAELVQSILEVGLLQPVIVRPAVNGRHELVMGERRWRATQQAGLKTIPAIVRDTADDALLRDALLENLHRAQLNALEEAAAYQQLLEDFGCTHDELASRIGRSRPQISNTIRLLKLSPAVQRRVAAGVLSAGHARALLGVEDADVQDRLAGRVVAEGISVRGLEEIVAVDAGSAPVRAGRRNRPTAPGVEDLAARLSDLLETRVRVDLGKRKGRITVEFASLPDLERIVGLIDPGHPGRTRQADAPL